MILLKLFALLQFVVSAVYSISPNSSFVAEVDPKAPIKLQDLNGDIQLLLFDHMNLSSWIRLAETNKHFKFLAADAFKRKYSKKTIKYSYYETWTSSSVDTSLIRFIESEDAISFQHYETFLKVIKHFGYLITKLEISFENSYKSDDFRRLSEFVNFYCADTLQQFEFHYHFHGNVFEHMKKPFLNVEHLLLTGNINSYDSKTLTMNKLFPAVHSLTLQLYASVNEQLAIEFPNLNTVTLDVNAFNIERGLLTIYINTLLKSNPQIRTLKLRSGNRSNLKSVNDALPKLENLEIFQYLRNSTAANETRIVFKNVRNLTVLGWIEDSAPQNVEFENLVEFTTNAYPNGCYRWIDLIENSKTLKKLNVIHAEINGEVLDRLAKIDLNVVKVTLQLKRTSETTTTEHGDITSIVNFVQQRGKLNTIRFIVDNAPEFYQRIVNELQKHLTYQWKITTLEPEILLERQM